MAVFSFDPQEMEGIAPPSAQEQYLKKFGFTLPPLPEGFAHKPQLEDHDTRMTPPPSPGRVQPHTQTNAHPHTQDTGFGTHNGGGEQVNMLVAKRKNNKKRIQPTFMGSLAGSVPSAANPSDSMSSASVSAPPPQTNGRSFHEITGISSSSRPAQISPPMIEPALLPVARGSSSGGRSTSEERVSMELSYPTEDVDMNTDVQISALETSGRGKRKASAADLIDERPGKPRTLGGDRVRDAIAVRELAPGSRIVIAEHGTIGPGEGLTQSVAGRLPMPALLNYLKATVEGSDDIFEARNADDGGEFIFH